MKSKLCSCFFLCLFFVFVSYSSYAQVCHCADTSFCGCDRGCSSCSCPKPTTITKTRNAGGSSSSVNGDNNGNSNDDPPPHEDTCAYKDKVKDLIKLMRKSDKGECDEDETKALEECISNDCKYYKKALQAYEAYCKKINKDQEKRQRSEFDGIINKNRNRQKSSAEPSDGYRLQSVMSYVDAKYIISYKAYSIARKSSNPELKKAAPYYLRMYKEASAEKLRIMLEDDLYDPVSPKNPAAFYNLKFSTDHKGNSLSTKIDEINEVNKLAQNLESNLLKTNTYYDINKEVEKIFTNSKNKSYFEDTRKRVNKALSKDQSHGKQDPKAPKSNVSDDKKNNLAPKGMYSKNNKNIQEMAKNNNNNNGSKNNNNNNGSKNNKKNNAADNVNGIQKPAGTTPDDAASDREVELAWKRMHGIQQDEVLNAEQSGQLLREMNDIYNNMPKEKQENCNEQDYIKALRERTRN